MIPLNKLQPATEIEAALADHTQRFLELVAANQPIPESLKRAYADQAVKDLLRQETNDKCAYCESKISHTYFGDVEHIIPKVHAPHLRYDYNNLTFACAVCNRAKLDYQDDELPLLNPFTDDPRDHLHARGPLILSHGSDRGFITLGRLDLNRAPLAERRAERINQLNRALIQWSKTGNRAIRDQLLLQIKSECLADREFSFVASTYVEEALALMT